MTTKRVQDMDARDLHEKFWLGRGCGVLTAFAALRDTTAAEVRAECAAQVEAAGRAALWVLYSDAPLWHEDEMTRPDLREYIKRAYPPPKPAPVEHTLPSGRTFRDNKDGTWTLLGTPYIPFEFTPKRWRTYTGFTPADGATVLELLGEDGR